MKLSGNGQEKVDIFKIKLYMKTIKFTGFAGLLLIILSLASCGLVNQARELDRFAHCKFTLNSVALENISGIDMSHVKTVSDLNFTQMIVLSRGLLEGKLLAKVLFSVEVSNPSGSMAAVSGMDWKLLQKQQIIASGELKNPVQVAGHGRSSFYLNAKLNLVKIFQLNSLDQILSVMSGNLDSKTLEKLGITIQLKPYYKLDGKIKKYPGYLTITPEFEE